MDREPWPSTYDRDLDVPQRAPLDPTEPIDPYRRLVANPGLAVVVAIGAILLLRASLRWRQLEVFLLAVGLLGSSWFLVQAHCLDCGRTIWLRARRRHACHATLSRWREGRRGSWPFLDVEFQAFAWIILAIAVSIHVLIFRGMGP